MVLLTILYSILAVLTTLGVIIAVDIYRLPKSRFYETRDLLSVYFLRRLMVVISALKWRAFQKHARDFVKVQEKFVLEQIRANEGTTYGRDHQFQRIHSLADFRRLHPVTDYYHYSDYIAKAKKGDTNAMLGNDQIEIFACSSGTTGKPKHIPVGKKYTRSIMALFGAMYGFRPQRFFGTSPLIKEMQVMCVPRWQTAESGVRIGPFSAVMIKQRMSNAHWAIPYEAIIVDTEAEALYVSLLFALRDREISFIEGGFATGLLNLLKFLEEHWRDLVADIRSGRLKEDLDISDDKRCIINRLLVSDAERARELELEFRKGMGGIVKRIFPNLLEITASSSGSSMDIYRRQCLPFVKDIPIVSSLYGSSEAFMGINMRSPSEDPAYVLVPDAAFVEFLPVDETGSLVEGQEPVLGDQVKIGQLYEIVLTNRSGLYRYRLGDVVKVVDFYHQAPAVDFQFRTGQLLNVYTEKLSEESFLNALQAAVARWPGVVLRDFTSAESVLDPSPRPGAPYYLVFLEIESGTVTQKQLDMIDETLCEKNYVYKSFRVKDTISPMKVLLVESGAFSAFRQFTFHTTTTFLNQFKQPRVLRNGKQVECFMKCVRKC